MPKGESAAAYSAAVAAILAEERKARDVTFDELAEDTGIAKRHLVRLLKGEISLRVEDLYRVCEALGVAGFVVLRQAAKATRG